MCYILKVKKSSYYASFKKADSKTSLRKKEISQEILQIYEEHNGIYDTPKIHALLLRKGINCSLKLVQRIMKFLNIKSIIRKRFKPQNSKTCKEPLAENLLEQNFTIKTVGEKIVGDITYIKTSDYGWCYLASFLDLHINEIIGWDFSAQMTTELVLNALAKENVKRSIKNSIFHTDRRSQYTSNIYSDTVISVFCNFFYITINTLPYYFHNKRLYPHL